MWLLIGKAQQALVIITLHIYSDAVKTANDTDTNVNQQFLLPAVQHYLIINIDTKSITY